MHAFTTSCRRAAQLGFAGALSVACAVYVDEAPHLPGAEGRSGASAGSVETAGSAAGLSAETSGSGGGGGVPSAGSGGTLPSAAGGGVAGAVAGGAGVSGLAGQAGNAGAMGGGGMAGGSAGASGAAGSGGASGSGGVAGSGGAAGNGGAGGAGSGGKGGGGNGGAGGSGAVTCTTNPITAKTKWTVTASSSDAPAPPSQACDNMVATRWTTGKEQTGVEWLALDFGAVVKLSKLTLVLGSSTNDYPRKYATRFAATPPTSSSPVLVSGMGAASTDTVMQFPAGATGRYVLINQSGSAPALWWSVAEIQAECAD